VSLESAVGRGPLAFPARSAPLDFSASAARRTRRSPRDKIAFRVSTTRHFRPSGETEERRHLRNAGRGRGRRSTESATTRDPDAKRSRGFAIVPELPRPRIRPTSRPRTLLFFPLSSPRRTTLSSSLSPRWRAARDLRRDVGSAGAPIPRLASARGRARGGNFTLDGPYCRQCRWASSRGGGGGETEDERRRGAHPCQRVVGNRVEW